MEPAGQARLGARGHTHPLAEGSFSEPDNRVATLVDSNYIPIAWGRAMWLGSIQMLRSRAVCEHQK